MFCRKYLDDFCNYQLQAMQDSALYWDHALLLTGHDLYSDYPRIDRGSSGTNIFNKKKFFIQIFIMKAWRFYLECVAGLLVVQ